jgi:hypothetical protein
MAQVCPAWEKIGPDLAFGPGQDVTDALDAGDYAGASAAFDTMAQFAADAQRLLRYVPSWNKLGDDYVQRLVREAAAWHKEAALGAMMALEQFVAPQAEHAELSADMSEETVASNQAERMETVLRDRYGFDCLVWLKNPPPTPTPKPTPAAPGS